MPTVLLVVASEDLYIALSRDLSKEFYVISCHPKDTITVLQQEHPFSLVLDLRLTGTDGLSLLKQCSGILPPAVLLLTPFLSTDLLNSAINLGVNHILLKPFRISCIREYLMDNTIAEC